MTLIDKALSTKRKAYRAWAKAADIGYGSRNHTKAHMDKVDTRIRLLRDRFEQANEVYKALCREEHA